MHLLYGTQTKTNRLEIIVSPFCLNKGLANNYSWAWRLKGNKDTAISIYVVGSKLQAYATRPKGGMGRLDLILGFRGCRREMDMEAENTISIALRVLTDTTPIA